jgi:hypothetical protein
MSTSAGSPATRPVTAAATARWSPGSQPARPAAGRVLRLARSSSRST